MTTEYYIDGWHLLCDVQKNKIFKRVGKIAKTNYFFVVSARPPKPFSNSTTTKKIFVKIYTYIFLKIYWINLTFLRTTYFIKFDI